MTDTVDSVPEDVGVIAGKLTEAQRAAMLRAEPDGHLGKYFIRWWMTNGRTARAIKRKELAFSVWSGVALTPKGALVRDYLLSLDEDK